MALLFAVFWGYLFYGARNPPNYIAVKAAIPGLGVAHPAGTPTPPCWVVADHGGCRCPEGGGEGWAGATTAVRNECGQAGLIQSVEP
jgi:hypothetical protein